MGISIVIGEAEFYMCKYSGAVTVTVKERDHRDEKEKKVEDHWLPVLVNSISQSYSSWGDFLDSSKTRDLFDIDHGELMTSKSSGCKILLPKHLDALRNARKALENINMDKGTQVIFDWAEYWMKWSLENCKLPVVYSW